MLETWHFPQSCLQSCRAAMRPGNGQCGWAPKIPHKGFDAAAGNAGSGASS
ncbi:hypothetical protein LOAG_18980, partial [Loa loa]